MSFIEVSDADINHSIENQNNVVTNLKSLTLSTPRVITNATIVKDPDTFSTYQSEIGFNYDEIELGNVLEEQEYEFDVSLTCSNSSSNNIEQRVIGYNGGTTPTWVQLDTANSKLNFTTPDVNTNTTYEFAIFTNITDDSITFERKVNMAVVECDIENCAS